MSQRTLAGRWYRLLASLTADETAIQQQWQQLAAQYETDGRVYHTLAHVRDVLNKISSLEYLAQDGTAVYLAAWYHDAVYDSHLSNNEERSAAFAAISLQELGIAPALVTAVQRLILATKTHQAAPDDSDAQLLLDADLAILGAEPARYDKYARAIRQEYDWVDDDAYRHGRGAVLEQFLLRRSIYHTPPMRATHEAHARRNLKRELKALGV
jgi:predicted metal-dependent HD superfamily phosphohydrolase